jgi:PAS domain S-box-containing protein
MKLANAAVSFFRFPYNEDERAQNIANLIHIIAVFVLFGVTFLLVQRIVVSIPSQLPLNALVLILMCLAIRLNQKGKIKPAGSLLMWTLLVFLFYLLIYNDGTHDTAMLAYTAALVFAGIILKRNEFILYTVLAVLSVIILSVFEIFGIIVNNYSKATNIVDIIDIILILTITALSMMSLTSYLVKIYEMKKKNEEALIENTKQLKIIEERFDQVADSAGEWVWEVSADGLYIYSSRIVSKILGYMPDETINKKYFYDFLLQANKDDAENEISTLFAEHKVLKEIKAKYVTKTGGIVILQANGFPLFSDSGEFIGYRGASIDITEKELNLIKLNQFAEIFNRVNYSLYIFHLEDKENPLSFSVVYANPVSAKMWGNSEKVCMGCKIEKALPFIKDNSLYDKFVNVIKENKFYRDDNFNLTTENDKRYFTLKVFPLDDNCISVSFEDITLRKNNEIQLAESQARLFAVVESTNYPIWSVDCRNFGLISYNHSFVSYFKEYYEIDIQIGLIPGAIYPEEQAKYWIGLYNRALSDGPYRIEYSTVRNNHTLLLSFNLMKTEGKVFGISVFAEDITERKQAQDALSESEERFRKLVTNVPDTIIQTDANNTIIFINKDEIKGAPNFKKEKMIGRKIFDYVSEESMADAVEGIAGRSSQKVGLREYKVLLEGIALECEINGDVLLNSAGDIAGMVYVVRNITQRKKDEAALRQSLLNFRRIFNHSPYAMVINELEGDMEIIDVNEAYLKLTEFNYGEIINKPAYILNRRMISKLRDDPFEKFGFIENEEVVFKTKFGKQKYALISSRIIEYDYKKCALTVLEDISEKKKVQLELNDSYTRYRALFEYGNDAVFIMDMNSFIDCNIKAVELLGAPKDEIIGKNPLAFSPEFQYDRKSSFEKFFDETAKNMPVGKVYRFEWKVKHSSGKLFDSEISVTKIILSGHEYLQAVMRDISDRKRIENDLEIYRKHLEALVQERTYKLEEVNRLLQNEIIKQKESEVKVKIALEKEKEFSELKSQFISTASHEFRTPLAIIQSSTELLQRYGKNWSDEEYNEQISAIKSNIADLTKMMNNILIISRTETGAIKFEPQDVNLNKLCLNLIENIKYLLSDNKSINFNYNVKENIFKLDEVLLKFIIQNLLSNAVKYSFPDTIIDFEVNKQNSSLYIKVSDRGIGIPQEDYSSLFEPFHRGSNVGEIKGTGLGMSIIKRAVEFHKAEISFYSEVNVGTTFLLKIPAEIPQEISE